MKTLLKYHPASGSCCSATPASRAGSKRGVLATGVLMAAVALALPGLAQAQQGCGGAISIATNPNTTPPNQIPFTGAPLGELVRVMLTPAKGAGTLDLTVSQVNYALACADNNDLVPCAFGNDGAAGGGAPIAYAGNVGGTCGATDGTSTDNGDGTLTFQFPAQVLNEAGCTVEFDVIVNDKGTDASPLVLTGAASTNGTCAGGLNGAARGSVAIFLETVPDIEILKEISIDGGTTWFDANDAASAPVAEVGSGALYRFTVTNTGTAKLNNVTVEDAELGISPGVDIGMLDVGEFVVLTSGTAGFENLDVDERCGNAGQFTNIASVEGTSADDGTMASHSDPANLICERTDIEIVKEISIDGGTTWFDANDVAGAPVAQAPSDALYRFTVRNIGTTNLVNVTVSDATLGIVDYFVGNLAVGGEVVITEGEIPALFVEDRCTTAGQFANIATTEGESAETGAMVSDSDPALLVCQVQVAEICRTPGFWGTHAGTEKRNSTDLTQLAIDAAGGSLSICGATIDNTLVPDYMSAVEAMCVSVQGDSRLQLTRQLTAMALNCVVSGGGADCSGTSVASLFQAANEACELGVANLGDYIAPVDCFNNGGQVDSATGECVIDPENNCHERDLSESDVFDGVSPLPGPAGSSKACNAATKNNIIVLP
ncbi:MAG: hypothetical protein U1A22_03975 [Xanthomonadaceae bacterium]|nr:hypothetical protein [Xanthomonadaceae bacterium]